MSKFTFIHEDDNVSIWHDVNSVMLSEIISQFQNFLRGCGFHFIGELIIDDWNVPETVENSVDEPVEEIKYDSTFHVI